MDTPLGLAYRYTDTHWRDWDPYEERHVGLPHHEIGCLTYAVLKETPKGFWIDYGGEKKFVLNDSRRRFAHRTQAEALTSFIARKQAQVRILKSQLKAAEAALWLAQQEQAKGVTPCPL